MQVTRAGALLTIGLALFGLGCPTTNVVLGNDDASGTAVGAAGSAGMWFGGAGGVGGGPAPAGLFGGIGGFTGVGGASGFGGSCAPSQATLESCAPYANNEYLYEYHACLNQVGISMGQGVGGAPGALCEGYSPCSYQHEGCLYYQTSGAAGSNSGGCAGAPGDPAWLSDCGGDGYYGEEIIGGMLVGGAGGVGGSVGGTGGDAGAIGGASGMATGGSAGG